MRKYVYLIAMAVLTIQFLSCSRSDDENVLQQQNPVMSRSLSDGTEIPTGAIGGSDSKPIEGPMFYIEQKPEIERVSLSPEFNLKEYRDDKVWDSWTGAKGEASTYYEDCTLDHVMVKSVTDGVAHIVGSYDGYGYYDRKTATASFDIENYKEDKSQWVLKNLEVSTIDFRESIDWKVELTYSATLIPLDNVSNKGSVTFDGGVSKGAIGLQYEEFERGEAWDGSIFIYKRYSTEEHSYGVDENHIRVIVDCAE